MALVDEDGTGKADAESYGTVAYVSAYLAARGREAEWDALATTVQEQTAREATEWLDRRYGSRYDGTRYDEDQALYHPREGIIVDGVELEVGTVNSLPVQLQRAFAEVCYVSATLPAGESLNDVADVAGKVKATRDQVGPLETEVEYAGVGVVDGFGSDGLRVLPVVDELIAPLLVNGGSLGRIVRS